MRFCCRFCMPPWPRNWQQSGVSGQSSVAIRIKRLRETNSKNQEPNSKRIWFLEYGSWNLVLGIWFLALRELWMFADLIDLVQRLQQPRVLVLGDVMLDRYIWGDAERISQEAPVILLHADKREERLGGASSVATMLRALGARVALAGVVGADSNAERIRQLLTDLDIDQEAVHTDAERRSTVKE